MSAQPGDGPAPNTTPSDEDFAVARETLAVDPKAPEEGSAEWDSKVGKLAAFRAEVGGDRFDVLFGRREPRNGAERLGLRYVREGWDEERARAEYQAFAERPVDREMVGDYSRWIENRLRLLSELLGEIIGAASDQRDPGRARRDSPKIHRRVPELIETPTMFAEEIRAVDAFLTRVRAKSGAAVVIGAWTGAHAHGIAGRAMVYVHDLWMLKWKTATKSQTAGEYMCETTAAELVYGHLEGDKPFPAVADLIGAIMSERAMAELALEEAASAGQLSPVTLHGVEGGALEDLSSLRAAEPADDGCVWVPANVFSKDMARKVKQAAQPKRKAKRVRRKGRGRDTRYCLNDVAENWPTHLTPELKDLLNRNRA